MKLYRKQNYYLIFDKAKIKFFGSKVYITRIILVYSYLKRLHFSYDVLTMCINPPQHLPYCQFHFINCNFSIPFIINFFFTFAYNFSFTQPLEHVVFFHFPLRTHGLFTFLHQNLITSHAYILYILFMLKNSKHLEKNYVRYCSVNNNQNMS